MNVFRMWGWYFDYCDNDNDNDNVILFEYLFDVYVIVLCVLFYLNFIKNFICYVLFVYLL